MLNESVPITKPALVYELKREVARIVGEPHSIKAVDSFLIPDVSCVKYAERGTNMGTSTATCTRTRYFFCEKSIPYQVLNTSVGSQKSSCPRATRWL